MLGEAWTEKSLKAPFLIASAKPPSGGVGVLLMGIPTALGDSAAGEGHFKSLLEIHPEYVAGYFHFGQLLSKLGRTSGARQILSAGIAQATRLGDQHARSEIQAALDELS